MIALLPGLTSSEIPCHLVRHHGAREANGRNSVFFFFFARDSRRGSSWLLIAATGPFQIKLRSTTLVVLTLFTPRMHRTRHSNGKGSLWQGYGLKLWGLGIPFSAASMSNSEFPNRNFVGFVTVNGAYPLNSWCSNALSMAPTHRVRLLPCQAFVRIPPS